MFETQYEALRRQGVSRRSFLQFCSLTAASLGLGSAGAQEIAQAIETSYTAWSAPVVRSRLSALTKRLPRIWCCP